jgi:hypothetical protein
MQSAIGRNAEQTNIRDLNRGLMRLWFEDVWDWGSCSKTISWPSTIPCLEAANDSPYRSYSDRVAAAVRPGSGWGGSGARAAGPTVRAVRVRSRLRAPEEIAEIAEKLRVQAGLPNQPTGEVANGSRPAKARSKPRKPTSPPARTTKVGSK